VGFADTFAIVPYVQVEPVGSPMNCSDFSRRMCSSPEIVVGIHAAYSLEELVLLKVAGTCMVNFLSRTGGILF